MVLVEPFRGLKLIFLTFGLVLGASIVGMDYTLVNASLQYVAGGVSASLADSQWFVTAFSMGNAIALTLTGFLTDRFGSVRVLCVSLILYMIFSCLCGMAFNLTAMILFRALQGFVGGPIIPVGQALLFINFPLKQRGIAVSIWGLFLMIAPLSAPTIAAFLSQDFNWSWAFYINIPLAILALSIIWPLLRKRETEIKERHFDFSGLLFLSIGVISLQTILTKGQQWDWWNSNLIRTLTIISIMAFCFLFIVENKKKEPLVKFQLFKNFNFSMGTIMTVVSYMALFSSTLITPEWLMNSLNYTPLWAAIGTLPVVVFPFFILPFLPYLMRVTRKSFIVAGCFLSFSLSFFNMSFFYTDVNLSHLLISRLFFGLGVVYMTPLIALTFIDITKENLARASGIFFFCRVFSGSIGACIFQTIWERRTIFHHFNLIEHVTPFSSQAYQLFTKLNQLGFTKKESLAEVNKLVGQQASMLATNDVFWLSGWICLVLVFVVLIMGQIRVMKRKKFVKTPQAPS